EGEFAPGHPHDDLRAFIARLEADEAERRARVLAKTPDMGDAPIARILLQKRPLPVVTVQQNMAVPHQAFEDFRLCAGNLFETVEEPEVSRRDDSDHRDMRLHETHQLADL